MTFEQFLQQKKIIPLTIARQQREVNRYEKWLAQKNTCAATGGKTVESAEKKDLLDYLQHIKQSRKLCSVTQSKILRNIKNYYAYLAKEYAVNNITHFIKIRGAERKYLPPLFTPDELDLLCDAYYFHTQEYTPNRNELYHYPEHKKLLQGRYIALTLFAYQALQVHEIAALKKNDFDLRKGTVSVDEWRGGAERKLQLHPSQIGAIIQYFADEETTCGERSRTLIPSRSHINRLSKSLKKLHPKYRDFRQIRASKITHWLKLYGLRKAQHLAGHKNIHSTEKYLAGDYETLQNDMDNFHPLR